MYKIKRTLNNVNLFTISEYNLFHLSNVDNRYYFICSDPFGINKKKMLLRTSIMNINFINYKRWILIEYSDNGQGVFFSMDLEEVYNSNYFGLYMPNGDTNKWCICYQGVKYGLFSIDTLNTFFFDASFKGGHYIFSNRIYKLIESSISSFSIKKKEILWQIDLSSYTNYTDIWGDKMLGSIRKIIGIRHGLVWAATTNNTLISLDELTGDIKSVIRDLPNTDTLVSFSEAILDEKNGKILNLTNTSYCEIDCTTGSVTYTDLKEEFNRHNIEAFGASDWAHDGEYIYFFNTVNTSGGRVAIFHIPTKKIVWMHVFDKEQNIRPLELQYANNRIYVRDNHNTLHIFEKE